MYEEDRSRIMNYKKYACKLRHEIVTVHFWQIIVVKGQASERNGIEGVNSSGFISSLHFGGELAPETDTYIAARLV